MTPLPSGLADPLHLPLPVPWKLLAIFGAIFLAIVLWVLIRASLKRRREAPRTPAPAPASSGLTTIYDEIEAIRGRHAEAGSFRLACHELSMLLRRHFDTAGRHPFSTWTAGEILRQLGDGRTARFFGFLAELQFGRGKPSRNDLDGACDLAIEVVEERRW